MWENKKLIAFRPILDIINWKVRFLSHIGKKVLLKSVIQAIPTYYMGIFKIPKTILNEINILMNKFWWGQREDRSETHYLSWQQPGKAKLASELEF